MIPHVLCCYKRIPSSSHLGTMVAVELTWCHEVHILKQNRGVTLSEMGWYSPARQQAQYKL
jgi:hypothetical protein